MRYKIALIVGRFQPFHKGHLFLIKKALKVSDKLVFGIGSASIYDKNNPLNYAKRKKIIEIVINEEKMSNRVIKIVPLEDFFDNNKWLKNLEKQVGKFDLALGNNEWPNKILEKAGYKVLRINYYKKNLFEGWRIRELIKEGRDFKDRVPNYIYPFLISNFKFLISKFNHIVLGGTFDHFHAGHKALLEKAFEIGKKVTIGIATKNIYKDKFLAETIEPFGLRKKSVYEFIKKKGWLSRTKLISFSHFTGGADKIRKIEAIVISKETYPNALKINQLREKNKLSLLRIAIIDDVLAEDGKLTSSERIRAGEIDREGIKFEIRNPKSEIKELKMPESLRPTLQKPLGKIYKSVGTIHELSDKPTMIIAVGDIIVDSLLKHNIDPDVKIIDFKSRRRVIPAKAGIHINKSLINSKLINNPGTINLKTSEIIKEKIKLALNKKTKSWIVVEGEEDLLALPAILFAPLNSLVLYGHWQLGVIAVEVNEKMKKKVRQILSKFM